MPRTAAAALALALLAAPAAAQAGTSAPAADLALAAPYRPDYAAPPGAPYTAEEVVVPTPAGHRLAGTLTLPARRDGPVPAVVTLTGSSAHDRDNNTPTGGPYRVWRQLADTLGRRGIAVLRLDDRGVGASTGHFESATTPERADDARAALAYLRARPEVNGARLALVGLSEGAVIAPMVAARDTALAGIVLMAAPARPGHALLTWQARFRADDAPGLSPAGRDSLYAREMERWTRLAGEHPWLRFFWRYDPRETARRVRRVPVLVLHGATDRVVPPEDAARTAEALRAAGNPDVRVRVFAGLNHVFLRDPDGAPWRYGRLPSFAVGPEVLGAVAEWLAERTRPRG